MPQEIYVLLCYKCNTYQSQIVKKAKKWSCVICGENQSLKRTFGTGSGKDCRLLVQKLNAARHESNQELGTFLQQHTQDEANSTNQKYDNDLDEENDIETDERENLLGGGAPSNGFGTSKVSKWDKYLKTED